MNTKSGFCPQASFWGRAVFPNLKVVAVLVNATDFTEAVPANAVKNVLITGGNGFIGSVLCPIPSRYIYRKDILQKAEITDQHHSLIFR
jgi:hypothetical protein